MRLLQLISYSQSLVCTVIQLAVIFLLLSEHTPLERCCVHNMSPFVSSSGLSPGSRQAKVQRAKVWLSCTEPSVARSSCWSLPVGRYSSDTHCKGSVVVLARWTASNMAEEPQTSISHQVRDYLVSSTVGFNVPLDALSVISEAIFPADWCKNWSFWEITWLVLAK